MTAEDSLRAFQGKSSCPVCGCIEPKGSVRCAECGTFHSGIHLEEREAPPPGTLPEREVSDPMVYSLSDKHTIPDEQFQQVEEISSWQGGSTDFTVGDDEKPLARIDPDELDLPEPEVLNE
ncbi:MAG: hypothetical protein P8R00_01920 [Candidatus Poseidoniaceae archaeon]|nr:hypothetical protein [Candidatus Poseidoniaceae archaeon]